MCVLSSRLAAALSRRSTVSSSLWNRHFTHRGFLVPSSTEVLAKLVICPTTQESVNLSSVSLSHRRCLFQIHSRTEFPRTSSRFTGQYRLPHFLIQPGENREHHRQRHLCQKVECSKTMDERTDEPVKRTFQIIVAATVENNGIGKHGKLPWSLPKELKFFKRLSSETTSRGKMNAVVMGRKTWLSLPFTPLPGRLNVILSRTRTGEDFDDRTGNNVVVCKSLNRALEILAEPQYADVVENVYVIGGSQVLSESMTSPFCDAIHWTEIDGKFECDTFCPAVDRSLFSVWASTSPTVEDAGVRCSFVTYVRKPSSSQGNQALINGGACEVDCASKNKADKLEDKPISSINFLPKFVLLRHEEYQYLHLIRDIIETGNVKMDRTGTGTRSKFGCQMRFNLRKTFPLLTTKRVHWIGILEELLWFISGSTNAKVLQDKGVHIWDGHSSKEYLESLGLGEREEGDLGPIYGFQWRHFGAKYVNMHTDYTGQGFDQLADVIHKIKTNPDDRRIMLSAWNPADLQIMALPPCHMFAQFYVSHGELSCQMYQRSCDMGLGVPYNIASYSLLTCMIAHVCDLVPGDFVHVLGDAHVYKNHIEPLQLQLQNSPKPFPTLRIRQSAVKDINRLTADDFELQDYRSNKRINMKMAV